jgi:hypothetical protein
MDNYPDITKLEIEKNIARFFAYSKDRIRKRQKNRCDNGGDLDDIFFDYGSLMNE